MARFEAKVTVDYWFDVDDDDIDNETDAETWAWYHFQDYAYTAEIYDVEISENPVYDDEEDDDEDEVA